MSAANAIVDLAKLNKSIDIHEKKQKAQNIQRVMEQEKKPFTNSPSQIRREIDLFPPSGSVMIKSDVKKFEE